MELKNGITLQELMIGFKRGTVVEYIEKVGGASELRTGKFIGLSRGRAIIKVDHEPDMIITMPPDYLSRRSAPFEHHRVY